MSAPSNDWQTFQIFEAPCTLNYTIFSAGKLRDNVLGFCGWVDTLRAQLREQRPGLGGIPAEYASDVLLLLNYFFPPRSTADGAPSFLTISDDQASPWNPVRVARPITVAFHNGISIEVTDGPTALGYIFSVARMPAQVQPTEMTWSDHVVPLLAIYTRCIYLAYIFNQETPNGTAWQPRPLNVPFTTCAMSFTDSQNRLAVFLGSSYAPCSVDSSPLTTLCSARRILMGLWRGTHAWKYALSFYTPSRSLRPPPRLPIMTDSIIDGLYALLRGQQLSSPGGAMVDPPKYKRKRLNDWRTVIMDPAAAQTNFEILAKQHSAAWKAIQPPPPIDILPLAADQVYNHPVLRQQLRSALEDIMKIRWDTKYDRDAPIPTAMDLAMTKAIEICFLPHMFPDLPPVPPATQPAPNPSLPEIPPLTIPAHQIRAKAALLAIYDEACRIRVLDMLDRFYFWVQAGDDGLGFGHPLVGKYGSCSETYPAASLSPAYFPLRALPNAKDNPQQQHPSEQISQVQVISFQARYFNNAMCGRLAGQGTPESTGKFDIQTLNDMHDATSYNLYRRPCRDCTSMLPKVDILVNETYHDSLSQLYGQDVPTHIE
ncbi:hypothetical protein SUNI508_07942 [Seiridium unicorne]|uniref:Uncharacterized protein n=1 Tax=Seiridium unicorne TaxID=138068 RepID=A0ABR2UVI0_9PEZI